GVRGIPGVPGQRGDCQFATAHRELKRCVHKYSVPDYRENRVTQETAAFLELL
ncbi:uncharacterized, partial [Tachysurus ichikawai]